MRPRVVVDPDKLAAERAEVVRLLTRAQQHTGPYWPEAITNLERLATAEVPDVVAARITYQSGYHVTDGQASAEWAGYRP